MRRPSPILLGLLLVLTWAWPRPMSASPRGHLFIIGGGDMPASMTERFVALASLAGTGRIVIFPMASSVPLEVGPEQAEEFRQAGARDVVWHNLSREQALDPDSTALLDGAGAVFFSGGVQSRLADVLLDTPLHRRLLEFYEAGGVIGGTSAGAAVMSEVMITGDEKRGVEEGREFSTLEAGNIVTARGLGLVTTAIIDQYFATRKRHNRLFSVLADHPDLLGVGIDESTAAVLRPDGVFEVWGANNVIFIDPSAARFRALTSGRFNAQELRLHILTHGQRFDGIGRKVME